MTHAKVIFIHGNGGGTAGDHWIPSMAEYARTFPQVEVIAETMPDNEIGKASLWLPQLKTYKPDEQTILVGHSTGAIAAMRFAELHKLWGLILVGPYYTDLGDETERQSGYFDRPWNWNEMIAHTDFIDVFADIRDPYIPIDEARYLRDCLSLSDNYHELSYGDHFMSDDFPELKAELQQRLENIL